MAQKSKGKFETIQPEMPKKEKKESTAKAKRSEIVYKKQERIENLYHALGEAERTIQELSRIYTELPESGHRGVGGEMKPTEKQKMIRSQIGRAQGRADRLIELIERID